MRLRGEKNHLRPVQVMNLGAVAEAICGGFRREVSLRTAQEFVSDHEFLNGCGTQQRGKIVCMQVPLFVDAAIGGLLVETHGIRKSSLKQIVVTNRDAFHDVAEQVALFAAELIDGSDMALAQHQRLERPYGPEGHEHGK